MKTILPIIFLLAMTLGLQQVQAQAGKSYEEWRASSGKGKKAAAKPAKATRAKASAKAEGKATAPAAMAAPVGTFRGTMPCADCKGINTELALQEGTDGSGRTFTLQQTYLGKPAGKNAVTSMGKWILAKGNKQNPDAVVLQLIPTAGDAELMYFLQVSDTEVKLLDRRQEEIKSPHNYSLKKR